MASGWKALVVGALLAGSSFAGAVSGYPWLAEAKKMMSDEVSELLIIGDPRHGDPEQKQRLMSLLSELEGFDCLFLELDSRMNSELSRYSQSGGPDYRTLVASHGDLMRPLAVNNMVWADTYLEEMQLVVDTALSRNMRVIGFDMDYGRGEGQVAFEAIQNQKQDVPGFVEWAVSYRNRQMVKNIDLAMKNGCRRGVVFVGMGHLLPPEDFKKVVNTFNGESPEPIQHRLEWMGYRVSTIYMLGLQKIYLSPPRMF